MDRLKELPVIRRMKKDDYQEIAEIDKKLTGRNRLEYWKLKTAILEKESSTIFLVAQIKGKIVGFIIGYMGGWEYIVPENVGWISTIVVIPEYQGMGIGQMLFNEMAEHMKRAGIKSIYAFIYWRDFELLKFFNYIGFEKGDMITLKLDIR